MRELDIPIHKVCQLAQQAGAAIMTIYEQGFEVTTKADNSPLTEADLASHQILERGLQQLTPSFPVLSEESSATTVEQRHNWQTFWMLDPLDGTKEFVNRNGEFTVNIALIHKGDPVFGVVYVPVTKKLYWGGESYGAWRQCDNKSLAAISVRKPQTPPIVVGSRSHLTDEVKQFIEQIPAAELTSIGSSLKFCLLAQGQADLYPRLGPTSEWDTAAADAVLRGAGGQVIDLNTQQSMRYNQRKTLLNPNFVAFTARGTWWDALLLAHARYQERNGL